MSYSRETQLNPKVLAFYYTKTEIFNLVKVISTYRAKTLVKENGESMTDVYGMTEDEMDAFEIFMEEAAREALRIVLKMTTAVSDALVIDHAWMKYGGTANGININNCYVIKVRDEVAYNANSLQAVDGGIKRFLKNHCLAAWWSMLGHADETKKWQVETDNARIELVNDHLFQLRKKQLY